MKRMKKGLLLILSILVICTFGTSIVFVSAINFNTDDLENFIVTEETDEFLESEREAVFLGEEWFVDETEERYDGEILAGDEVPEDDDDFSMYNLDDPNETMDLNITINGITGLMATRLELAIELGVTWDKQTKFMIQGGCSDGEYVYYAFNSYKLSPRETICQKILCAKLNSDGTINIDTAKVRTFTYLDHANSLTYNSKTDQVIVANCYADVVENNVSTATNEHFRLTVLNAAYLRGEEGETSEATYKYIPCCVSSITYDEYEDKYIVGITGKKYSFAILNNNFVLEKVIGYQPGEKEPANVWHRNDIWCDHSNIYALVIKWVTVNGDKQYSNILTVFDKESIYKSNNVTATEINLNSTTSYESENLFRHGDKFLIGYSRVDTEYNNYGYVDISETDMFKVEYEPNYDRTNGVSGSSTSRKSSLVIHCTPTKLLPNTFSNVGYNFKGWAAYWVEGKKWYCDIKGAKSWESSYTNTDDLYLYSDGQKIKQTVPKGDTVVMVAQWKSTLDFNVTFLSNDDNNLYDIKQYKYGSTNNLHACGFIEDHRGLYDNNESEVFLGWNAHWVEGDKWYYTNADGSVKGWYKEGLQPDGYRKYIYADRAVVKQTVPKGNNVEMYAVWNEFKVYYFAGAREILFKNILTPTVCKIRADANSSTTSLKTYLDNEISPWYVYNMDDDKWCYRNESNNSRQWYEFGGEPSGYVKYINRVGTVRNTADAGEGLVMCWTAGTSSAYDFNS